MILSFDKYYPVVVPSYNPTQSDLYQKRLELFNIERNIIREIERLTRKFHNYELELYAIKNKELIVERQINNPTIDIYV
jgi:hypothetical protein